mgnify:CR=1 FL=1
MSMSPPRGQRQDVLNRPDSALIAGPGSGVAFNIAADVSASNGAVGSAGAPGDAVTMSPVDGVFADPGVGNSTSVSTVSAGVGVLGAVVASGVPGMRVGDGNAG